MSFSKDDQQKYKALYIQTAREYVEQIRNNLLQLQSKNTSSEIIDTLHREYHSLKGQSEMMGYTNIASLAALLEDLFLSVYEKKFTLNEEEITKFLDFDDAMKVCLDEIENTNNETDLTKYINDLHALVHVKQ